MLNLMNRGLPYTVLLRQHTEGNNAARGANRPDLLSVEFARFGMCPAFQWANPFCDVLRGLLFPCIGNSRRASSGYWDAAFAHRTHFCHVLRAFLSPQKSGARLSDTLRRLLPTGMRGGHFSPRFLTGIAPRRSFAAISRISEGDADTPVMGNPPAFCFLPITFAGLHDCDNWAQIICKKLAQPMRLVRFRGCGSRNVRMKPLLHIKSPSNIANFAGARVTERVNIPSAQNWLHAFSVAQVIALCGYAGEGHEALEAHGWTCERWKARGGFGSQGDGDGRANATREALWFSPHCLKRAPHLFDAEPEPEHEAALA